MNGRYAYVIGGSGLFDPLLDFFLADLLRESASQQRVHYLIELAATGEDAPAIVKNIQNEGVQLEGFASYFLPCFFTAQENESMAQVASRPPPPLPNKFVLWKDIRVLSALALGRDAVPQMALVARILAV